MKSLKFTHFYEKLINREKMQTYRLLFVPPYRILSNIKIDFEFKKELGWKKDKRVTLYVGKITKIYPKRLCDATEEEARRDGFQSKNAFVKGLMKMHGLKFAEIWGFFICWKEVIGGLEKYL
ncbi:MAG: hypothetical protein ACTSUK_07255 [Promethearchaeota archaeon]